MQVLETLIRQIFPEYNHEKFQKENGVNTDTILESVLDAVRISGHADRLVSEGWNLRRPTRSEKKAGRAFVDIDAKEIVFSMPWKSMPREDLRFIVFHEFGHVVDILEGRFYIDENETVIFNNQEVSEYYINFAMIFDDDMMYCSLPHELSANTWALKSGVVPLLEKTLICYKTATGEIPVINFSDLRG